MPVAAPTAAPVSESVTFYAPLRPEEGIKVPSQVYPVRFRSGVLETSDPEVIAAARRGVAQGLYLEANMDVALTCPKCSVRFRNQQAFELHLQKHYEK